MLRAVSPVLALAAAALLTQAAHAQEPTAPSPASTPLATWRVDVTGGMLTEPNAASHVGGAIAAEFARRIGASRVSLIGLLIAARHSDVGQPGENRYVYDRDWRIAALGVERVATGGGGRLDLGFGISGGMLWSRGRIVGQEGTPVPPGFPDFQNVPPTWSEAAALIPSLRAAYRVAGPLAVSARAAVVQHVFTDDLVGGTGGLLALGAAVAW